MSHQFPVVENKYIRGSQFHDLSQLKVITLWATHTSFPPIQQFHNICLKGNPLYQLIDDPAGACYYKSWLLDHPTHLVLLIEGLIAVPPN